MEREQEPVVSGRVIVLHNRRARRKKRSSGEDLLRWKEVLFGLGKQSDGIISVPIECSRCSTALEEGEDMVEKRRPARG
ncbi:unnamed protein product [Anisakis simplex]|uniref:Uncharacterized protein n=1 Tax=Anisakis simplex TaxID=6269 RepID=A0A0M3K436_ANISI|nr:unnamed protein product [Anisakis simplex]